MHNDPTTRSGRSGRDEEAARRRLSEEYDRYRRTYAGRTGAEEPVRRPPREEAPRRSQESPRRRSQEGSRRRSAAEASPRRTAQRPRREEPAESTRPTPRSGQQRRREAAQRRARLRLAGLCAALVAAVGVSLYGITHLVGAASADDGRGGTEPGSSAAGVLPEEDTGNEGTDIADAPDISSSASVTALSGQRLETILANRLSAENVATTPGSGSDIDANWGTFDASTVGGTGWSNIASWKARNSDVVGWLRIPNTNINYPVVVGPNNNYYTSLGYDKNYSYYGVIWADSDTKFGTSSQISQNTVLYGHNWTNYTATPFIGRAADIMFGQLPSFHYINFCRSTPYIHYSTEAQSMTWKVFAVFYTEESFNYIASDPGTSGLQYIINEAKARSLHDFNVDVNASDKILTLSTCTRAYGQTNQQRFVVMARLMRPGETISEVSITPNPDFKRPQL